MREQNIEVIRKACVAANPEIEQGYWIGGDDALYDPQPSWINEPMIRLADVLYSLTKLPDLEPFDLPGFWIEVIGRYNLRKDSLTDQSDECLAFLAALLK